MCSWFCEVQSTYKWHLKLNFGQKRIQTHTLLFFRLFCLFVATSTRIHLFCKLFFLSYFVWSLLQWPCFRVPHLHILELMFGILAPRSSLRQDTSNSAQQGLGSGSKCQRSSFQVTWSRCEREKELLERWSLKHTACRTPRAGWIYPVTEWLCESSNGLSQRLRTVM